MSSSYFALIFLCLALVKKKLCSCFGILVIHCQLRIVPAGANSNSMELKDRQCVQFGSSVLRELMLRNGFLPRNCASMGKESGQWCWTLRIRRVLNKPNMPHN